MERPRPRLPIGTSDFRKLRAQGAYYVDKTDLVERVLSSDAEVLLLPRPRRFGKTLNLSMLRCFLERSAEDRRPLFAGLKAERSALAQRHFQRHPVLSLTFKDVKEISWPACLEKVAGVLSDLYGEHQYLLDSGQLTPREATEFQAVLGRCASEAQYAEALRALSAHLARHHGEQVVILIDEYDTPIHAGYGGGYYDQVVAFFRSLLSGGLKDNADLFRGVLTGVLRVAKESIFSGLNNLAVYSLLRPEFAPCFGFTLEEVRRLTDELGRPDLLNGIQRWYDGYRFGPEVIFNPWSVLNFLSSEDKVFRPYWVTTSANDLVRDLVLGGGAPLRADLEVLLSGGAVEKSIEEDLALRDLAGRPDAVWSFLLFTGYLKAEDVRMVEGREHARLSLPNQEIAGDFANMVRDWLSAGVGGSGEVQRLLSALLSGEAPAMERYLSQILKVTLSYHDTAVAPERVYHGFLLGLLVHLSGDYEVRSNRESGYGRYDVMVLPRTPGRSGVVLELKTVDREAGETPAQALEAALRQLRERDYAAELRARGARPIHLLAAAFDGKRAYVRGEQAAP